MSHAMSRQDRTSAQLSGQQASSSRASSRHEKIVLVSAPTMIELTEVEYLSFQDAKKLIARKKLGLNGQK